MHRTRPKLPVGIRPGYDRNGLFTGHRPKTSASGNSLTASLTEVDSYTDHIIINQWR